MERQARYEAQISMWDVTNASLSLLLAVSIPMLNKEAKERSRHILSATLYFMSPRTKKHAMRNCNIPNRTGVE